MDIQHFWEKMKTIHNYLLDFIENGQDVEESYINLKQVIGDENIVTDKHEFKSFLHLASKIINNHSKSSAFFDKIQKIFIDFKDDIMQNFTNIEIFNLFKNNKKFLLFLMNEKLIKVDKKISDIIIKDKYLYAYYPEYFFPEIKPFINEKTIQKIIKNLPENFEENRKIGENDNHICYLIRNDLIDDFISYVNLKNIELSQTIQQSIFETNPFLIENEPTLIEYAAFFGSTQIFRYLYMNNVKLTPSLWIYSIHSQNPELIHLLEENDVELTFKIYEKCVQESIKCHHNDVTNYFQNIIDINGEEEEKYYTDILETCLKYYNFNYIQYNDINHLLFNYLCRYDYYIPVSFLVESKKLNINFKIIRTFKFYGISI